MASAVSGIRGALSYLRARPGRVQPQLGKTSYFGFSFGGIITANLANRYRSLAPAEAEGDLPRRSARRRPQRVRRTGRGRLAFGHPIDREAAVPLGCRRGSSRSRTRRTAAATRSSPSWATSRRANKDLVLTHTDGHGDPDLSSAHGVCAARKGNADAYDWNFCWKVWDALRDCAYSGTDCRYALGNTPQASRQRQMERRRADHAVEDPGRGADPALRFRPRPMTRIRIRMVDQGGSPHASRAPKASRHGHPRRASRYRGGPDPVRVAERAARAARPAPWRSRCPAGSHRDRAAIGGAGRRFRDPPLRGRGCRPRGD